MAEGSSKEVTRPILEYLDSESEIVNQGEKIEIQEMQYLKLLPDINMRFLQTSTKLGESGDMQV